MYSGPRRRTCRQPDPAAAEQRCRYRIAFSSVLFRLCHSLTLCICDAAGIRATSATVLGLCALDQPLPVHVLFTWRRPQIDSPPRHTAHAAASAPRMKVLSVQQKCLWYADDKQNRCGMAAVACRWPQPHPPSLLSLQCVTAPRLCVPACSFLMSCLCL